MLAQATIDRMQAALDQLRSDSNASYQALPGIFGNWWADVINAEPTAAGARSAAYSTDLLYQSYLDRFNAIRADPFATETQAAKFIADANSSYAGGSASIIQAATDILSPFTAIADTVADTAKDIAAGAKVGLGSLAVIGGIALGVFLLLRSSK